MSKVTKLTLSMPRQVLKQAKSYARIHKTSISSIVTRLFESLNEPRGQKQNGVHGETTVLTKASLGIIPLSPKADKSDLISDALTEKHRKR